MARIAFDKPTRDLLSRQLMRHLKDELDVEVDPVDAVGLVDFLAETLGPHFYNQGLADARAVVGQRAELIAEAIYELEQPLKR
jgi:uncharacterized protein (DUF2164 family)